MLNEILTKKKKKEKTAENTALPPTRRQKPSHKKPNGGGYTAVQPFSAIKKRHPFFDLTKGSNLRKE
jgi:hypothetical protein